MFRSLLCGLLACGFLATDVQAGIVSQHGRLQVQGTHLVDTLGKPIQISGMSLFWSTWGGQKFFNAGAIKTTVDWGATLLRVPIAVATPNSTPSFLYKSSDKAYVKAAVQAALDNDIYVLLDWHVEGDSVYEDSARAYFIEMAKEYGNRPNVMFEVYNEPTRSTWPTIKGYAERLIAEIRKYSPNLVVVGTPLWSGQPSAPASDPITSDANVAYAHHFYACSHGNSIRNAVRNAAKKVPILFTEWGVSAADGSGSSCTDSAQKWLDLADSLGISWANWSLQADKQTSSALIPTASSTGGWSDAQLSVSGKWVKTKIQEAAARGGVVIPPLDTTKHDTASSVSYKDSVVYTTFDMPYGQSPRQTDLAARMQWTDGGRWHAYADDSGSTVTNSAGRNTVADTAALTNSVQNGSLNAKFSLSPSKATYPWAAIEAFFKDTASWFDLRKLAAIGVRAKGTGAVRMQFLTRDVLLAKDWGTYGAEIPLDTAWSSTVVRVSDLVPSPYSAAASGDWTWADSGASYVNGLGFAVNADADLSLDRIVFYGIDSSAFANPASAGIGLSSGQPLRLSMQREGNRLRLNYRLSASTRVEARLLDLQGRVLAERSSHQSTGANHLELAAPLHGMAILQLRAGNLQESRLVEPIH